MARLAHGLDEVATGALGQRGGLPSAGATLPATAGRFLRLERDGRGERQDGDRQDKS